GEAAWKEFRDRWIGRKNGILTQVNDLWLKSAPGPFKRDVGSRINDQVKPKVEGIVEVRRAIALGAPVQFSSKGVEIPRSKDWETFQKLLPTVDVTLPGIRRPLRAEHPMLRTMNEIVSVFRAMGYSVADGPEIETDYLNFEALNFPPNHPARDTQDTIFVAGQEKKPQRDRLLLRTHTSPVQIRAMQATPPPVRIVVPGKVHRADTAD